MRKTIVAVSLGREPQSKVAWVGAARLCQRSRHRDSAPLSQPKVGASPVCPHPQYIHKVKDTPSL